MTHAVAVLLTIVVSFASMFSAVPMVSTPYMEDMPIATYEEEAYPAEEQTYEFPTTGVVVDVPAWAEAYAEIWNASSEDAFTYELVEDDEESDYPTLLLGTIADTLNIEMYLARESNEYWFTVTYGRDNAPVRKLETFDTYFIEAIVTGFMAQQEDITVGQTRELRTLLRSMIDYAMETAAEDESGTGYGSDGGFMDDGTYISLFYDAEYDSFDCSICF